MRAFAASAANGYDATTTSGLGSGLSSGSQKIAVAVSNSFYNVFCLIVVHVPNFIQIGQERYKLKRLAIGWLWLVGPVSQKIAVFISNSFYLVFSPI